MLKQKKKTVEEEENKEATLSLTERHTKLFLGSLSLVKFPVERTYFFAQAAAAAAFTSVEAAASRGCYATEL